MEKKTTRQTIGKTDSLLYDLYRYRVLSVPQINNLYYGNKDSCYKQLYRLKKKGLVDSIPMVRKNNGTKETACYHITFTGISRLIKKGMIEKEKARRADDNIPDSRELVSTIDTNELYVQLKELGYIFIGSREWKKEHGMNYQSYVKGGLETRDGKKYATYILGGISNNDELIKSVKEEIKKNKQTGRYMVFFKNPKLFKKYRDKLTSDEKGKIEYCLLPYTFIPLRLPYFSEKTTLEKLLSKYGELTENERITDYNNFADYLLTTKDGQRYYVFNFLLMDMVARERVRNYPHYQIENEGIKIIAVCWTGLTHLLDGVENLEYVKTLEINDTDFSDHEKYEIIQQRQINMSFRLPSPEEE